MAPGTSSYEQWEGFVTYDPNKPEQKAPFYFSLKNGEGAGGIIDPINFFIQKTAPVVVFRIETTGPNAGPNAVWTYSVDTADPSGLTMKGSYKRDIVTGPARWKTGKFEVRRIQATSLPPPPTSFTPAGSSCAVTFSNSSQGVIHLKSRDTPRVAIDIHLSTGKSLDVILKTNALHTFGLQSGDNLAGIT
ncbi:hypothetical protein Clacol_010145 [Clathrus columnatus]|uniref:Uncharacterized protein n=1 Tax=Clathrus columnatus TaxID=1419009 RepID=A0AAV5AQ29_9AGAM|nr:hypothetical protein Clacol_010145 [Clathrus columnatus]